MDPYIAANMTINDQSRNVHQHQNSAEQEMERQLQEFRRTVTIIIWTKANVEPLRLVCFIPTFPYFQLSHVPNVIDELGLSNGAYLDTFVPGPNQWEQHTITSVRLIDTQQRLLYKVRRSLMEALTEEECPSLRQELQQLQGRPNTINMDRTNGQQPAVNTQAITSPTGDNGKLDDLEPKNMLKRAAPHGEHDGSHNPKVHVSGTYYLTHSGHSGSPMVASPNSANPSPAGNHATSPSAIASSPQLNAHAGTSQQQDSVYIYHQNPVFYGSGGADTSSLPHYLIAPAAAAPPIPYHPHPPLKRWPNDYTVLELSEGFHAMDLLISQSPTGASMTQRTAFERVFGSRYVKSTVCRHRAVWRKAPRPLREQFEQMGTDDRACWGEFVRRVEGRASAKGAGSMSSDQGSAMDDFHDRQTPSDGDEVHGQEGVMNGMHNQVPSNASTNGMQNNMAVYDPSHSHHNAGHPTGHPTGHSGVHNAGHNTGHNA